jgi:heme/copper-type cytochrome/quinol oxidase subunit 2
MAGLTALAAFLLVARAVIGLLVPAVARREIPSTTALALAVGPLLIVYGTWIAVRVMRRRNTDERFTTWYGSEVTRRLRRLALAATAGLVIGGLFYSANSFAAAYGAGRGYDDAIRLPRLPEIVIDTKERLIGIPPGVIESALPAGKNNSFHYRYAGLRLLLESWERLFLVPGNWTAQSRTLVVPYDSDIRIQLVPRQQ